MILASMKSGPSILPAESYLQQPDPQHLAGERRPCLQLSMTCCDGDRVKQKENWQPWYQLPQSLSRKYLLPTTGRDSSKKKVVGKTTTDPSGLGTDHSRTLLSDQWKAVVLNPSKQKAKHFFHVTSTPAPIRGEPDASKARL